MSKLAKAHFRSGQHQRHRKLPPLRGCGNRGPCRVLHPGTSGRRHYPKQQVMPQIMLTKDEEACRKASDVCLDVCTICLDGEDRPLQCGVRPTRCTSPHRVYGAVIYMPCLSNTIGYIGRQAAHAAALAGWRTPAALSRPCWCGGIPVHGRSVLRASRRSRE